jgi:hypothetical protein
MTEENCKYFRTNNRCLLTGVYCVGRVYVYDSFLDRSEWEFQTEHLAYCPAFNIEKEIAKKIQKSHLDKQSQKLTDLLE